jgi:uncharacterized membrane protein YdfJ with MMPL/SSD domain
MLFRTLSAAVYGIDADLVDIEVNLTPVRTDGDKEPPVTIVGLPDAAVRESRERIRAAIQNCGHFFPFQKTTINLAPADVRKEGASFDLPIALGIVILATLVVLFLMTGSVVLPIKSLIMNFLNLSAVFGLLVLIFQDGRLEGFLDYSSPGAIEQTMPILLFAVAFGLSTDYAVFLLSRIKEARDNGASDSESVAIGLERTGRIVTAAALLFAVAMGAFATSQIIFIKENGVGTALAVLIDATLVRTILVPAVMRLAGRWSVRKLRT